MRSLSHHSDPTRDASESPSLLSLVPAQSLALPGPLHVQVAMDLHQASAKDLPVHPPAKVSQLLELPPWNAAHRLQPPWMQSSAVRQPRELWGPLDRPLAPLPMWVMWVGQTQTQKDESPTAKRETNQGQKQSKARAAADAVSALAIIRMSAENTTSFTSEKCQEHTASNLMHSQLQSLHDLPNVRP